MKKVKSYKGFVIATPNDKDRKDNPSIADFLLFLKDEWEMGEGLRYSEHEAGSMKEAVEFIDDYKN